ncbi:hypothetical protein HMPREF0971_00656 [Segatella oris F0302]|uniref:Uncharacterized protein n=1 Tax=Segatella oris F0302 TaxID=649760 RepID=D1QNY7_9BACT|nr:hypothetical protein HMPREF0971_00656 [Segatella oris F0302]
MGKAHCFNIFFIIIRYCSIRENIILLPYSKRLIKYSNKDNKLK